MLTDPPQRIVSVTCRGITHSSLDLTWSEPLRSYDEEVFVGYLVRSRLFSIFCRKVQECPTMMISSVLLADECFIRAHFALFANRGVLDISNHNKRTSYGKGSRGTWPSAEPRKKHSTRSIYRKLSLFCIVHTATPLYHSSFLFCHGHVNLLEGN